MNSDYRDSDDQILSSDTIQALQKCAKNKDTEGFKGLCQSEISKFHLYAQGKTSDWNKFVNYIEKNFSGIYPHLVTDALVDFLTQHEFQRQSSNDSITLPYPLSNGLKFLLEKENIQAKVAQAIERSKLGNANHLEMTNCDNPERPIGRYQDFLDTALGTDMTQAMENRHAARVLEAIDYADKENYVEASALFLMAFNTAPTDIGKQYCEILAKAANDAYNAHENALANVASETKAKEIAKASWYALSKELSIYLNFLGVYFSERKKYLEAIQYYDRAITINPSYAMAYFSRGGTKADLHLYNEASQDLKIAEQLFNEQGDLSNYQNARKISMEIEMEIEYLNSSSAQEEVLNNAQPRATNFNQAVEIINDYFYSPDNPYLSAEEKLEVAMWYSLPGNLMVYAFLATAIYSTIYPLNWLYLIGIPLAINLVSGLINWSIYSKSLMNALYVNILLNNLITLTLRIAGIVILVSKGNYILAIAVLLSFFGFLTPFEPHLTLYVYLSKKYKMNPQYAFFKRFYNFKFPFEEVR